MNNKEFLERYHAIKVKFNAYYKYTFIFEGKGPEGEEITIWVGGDIKTIYRLDIDQDKGYLIGDFMYPPIVGATIETEEEAINVIFDRMKEKEAKKITTCDICGFQSTHEEDFHITITGGVLDTRCYCSGFPYGTYVEPSAFTERYEKWQRCVGSD